MNKLTTIFRWRLSPGTVRVLLLVLFAFLVAAAVVGLTVVKRLSEDLPSPARILNIDPPSKTVILAANGDTIHEYYVENRTAIPLAEIPVALRQAVIATEDRRFYDHYGLDARRLAKVVYENLTSTTRPGASTITQQLARNLFLSFDKKVSRKLKEMILALQLEQTYSKDEILEMYLNVINFGSGATGSRRRRGRLRQKRERAGARRMRHARRHHPEARGLLPPSASSTAPTAAVRPSSTPWSPPASSGGTRRPSSTRHAC